jgi:two-component system, OmpR family, sensor kinase
MNFKRLRGQPLSLRVRTTSWYVGLLAVALLVFSIAIYFGIRNYLKSSAQRVLTGAAQSMANDYLSQLPTKGEAWFLEEASEAFASIGSDHFVRVTIGSRVFFRTRDISDPYVSLDSIPLRPPSEDAAFHRLHIGHRNVMVYSMPVKVSDGRVFEVEVGTSLLVMQQTMHSIEDILIIASVLILVFAAIGGHLLMSQPLRPLVVLTEQAANIGRTRLGTRLPVIPTGDELERLTHSLNGMIYRLEEALNHNHRFSADASHELRTPLTIMRGEMEEMLQRDDLPPQAVENLVSTLEEIDRMSRIVNSLMVITRLDAGGEHMEMQLLNLSTLVGIMVEHLQALGEEKDLPLIYTCEPDVQIFADPMRIKQVLVNLIDNAIKYTAGADENDNAGTPGPVEVAVSISGDYAHLRISDHGIGIPPEALPHIFERFYRADYARSRGAGGVGLGLAIVKAIVTTHDGLVSITSTPGNGTVVLVQFPLAKHNR